MGCRPEAESAGAAAADLGRTAWAEAQIRTVSAEAQIRTVLAEVRCPTVLAEDQLPMASAEGHCRLALVADRSRSRWAEGRPQSAGEMA